MSQVQRIKNKSEKERLKNQNGGAKSKERKAKSQSVNENNNSVRRNVSVLSRSKKQASITPFNWVQQVAVDRADGKQRRSVAPFSK